MRNEHFVIDGSNLATEGRTEPSLAQLNEALEAFKVEHLITVDHFEDMAKLVLVTSSIVFYAYLVEYFTAWYSGEL